MEMGSGWERKYIAGQVQASSVSSAGVHRCKQVSFVALGLILEERRKAGGCRSVLLMSLV